MDQFHTIFHRFLESFTTGDKSYSSGAFVHYRGINRFCKITLAT
jgi:hypothetical protein